MERGCQCPEDWEDNNNEEWREEGEDEEETMNKSLNCLNYRF